MKMTEKQKVRSILDKLSEQELKDYIYEEVLIDTKQRTHFLINFNYLLGDAPNSNQYRDMVQDLIYEYSDHGFVDYGAASDLCSELSRLLGQAESYLKQEPERSFVISSVVLEAMPDLAQSIDDSSGETSGVVYSAVENIIHYLDQIDGKRKQRAFKWCMQTYLDDQYSDYGYDDVDRLFYYFCTEDTPDKEKLLQVLDKKIATAGRYSKSSLLSQKAELLIQWGKEGDARSILMDNLDDPKFRRELVKEKLAEGKTQEAIQLIKEGIKIAEKDRHFGTVSDWQMKLLDIAQQQNNQEEIAHWAEKLLLNRFSIDYYRLLKQSSKNWTKYYPKLLEQLEKSAYDIAQIYEEEKDHQALFELIKKKSIRGSYGSGSLSLLKRYLPIIAPHYADEILDIFKKEIYKQAKTTGRSSYAEVVRNLKEMQKVSGGKVQVKDIIADFQVKYRNRPAMQEMLAEV